MVSFLEVSGVGIERPALAKTGQKVSGGHFLGRGRFPGVWSAGRMPVKQTPSIRSPHPTGMAFAYGSKRCGNRKAGPQTALAFFKQQQYNTVRQIGI